MTTGKVEYAPDYKSEQLKAAMEEGRKIADSVIAANKLFAERARLERLVIEAAKKWYAQAVEHDFDLYPEEQGMADVVKILIDFESQQIKK